MNAHNISLVSCKKHCYMKLARYKKAKFRINYYYYYKHRPTHMYVDVHVCVLQYQNAIIVFYSKQNNYTKTANIRLT